MTGIVSLREFVDQLDFISEECHVYVNRRTGEFLGATSEELSAAEEDDEDGADLLPEWQRDMLPKVREVLTTDDWLALPDKFEISEYGIMREFCYSLSDQVLQQDLLDTIGGQGTFRRFKNMLHRRDLLDKWYAFRHEALKEFAIEWLEAHELSYRE